MIPLYNKILGKIFNHIKNDTPLPSTPQDDNAATYSVWRDENDYSINWHGSAKSIIQHINSVGEPYNGASSSINGRKVRILDAREVNDVIIENRSPGKIIFLQNKFPVVICGLGLIKSVAEYE